jgi:hypothetical protein
LSFAESLNPLLQVARHSSIPNIFRGFKLSHIPMIIWDSNRFISGETR